MREMAGEREVDPVTPQRRALRQYLKSKQTFVLVSPFTGHLFCILLMQKPLKSGLGWY